MEPTIQEKMATLDMIKKMEGVLDKTADNKEVGNEMLIVLDSSIQEMNQVLFPGTVISKIYQFDCRKDGKVEFEKAFYTWKNYVETVIEKTLQKKNIVEADFEMLMAYLEVVSLEELEQLLKDNFSTLKKVDIKVYALLIKTYEKYQDFWGALNPEKGIFECINQRAKALKEHTAEWRWLFGQLCDSRSKKVLYNVLANWITFKVDYLEQSREKVYKDYFDLDLIPEVTEEEVFVDLGGYIGDTVEDFVNAYSAKYKRIYTYEINPHNLECLKETVEGYPNIVVRENAVGEKEGILYLDLKIGGSSTTLALEGEQQVKVVSIDEDITEKVTWIKMDIEGSEQSALRGCKRHIEEEKPKLTICTYHNNEDIWKIPMMIKEYNPDYQLYFRYNGRGIHPSEYVLFAL